jgi:hypothetical protein
MRRTFRVTIDGHHVIRTYRIRAWTHEHPHVVHVTREPKGGWRVYLDTCGTRDGRVANLGQLSADVRVTKDSILRAVNM